MHARNLYWQSLANCRAAAVYMNNKLKPFYCPIQQRNNHGVYAVHINAKIGFFAQLNWCLYIFAHCERFNLKPCVFLASPFYTRSKGENWLAYHFENLKLTETDKNLLGKGDIKYSYISDIEQMGLPADYGTRMTLEYASHLLGSNLKIKGEIQDCVDSFVEKYFGQRTVLGVHYRGTDKKSEAQPVNWDYAARTISNYLDANPKVDALFVASDEGDFIEWIRTKFKSIDVIFHNDTERSRDGKAIHVQVALGDNYIKGKEALVNSLLLSKCDTLIRTSSFLSAWSSIFNPCLPVIMLNRPFDDKLWFPDAVIVKNSLQGYLPS